MVGAWDHDWSVNAYAELKTRGFSTMFDFARTRETAPFRELASDLAGDKLAPVQVQKLLEQESIDTDKFRYFVRSSLLRNLYEHVPHGIRCHGEWPLTLALASWAGSMPSSIQSPCGKVAKKLKGAILPDDWLPNSVDDREFAAFFSAENL